MSEKILTRCKCEDELRFIKLIPIQVVELEKLRRELAYRRQLNEQQNNMIAQQRAQLTMGQVVD